MFSLFLFQVTVIVNDINDNTPQFVNPPQSTQINEAARRGSNVIQVSASDKDLGFAGKVVYNITDGNSDGRSISSCLNIPQISLKINTKLIINADNSPFIIRNASKENSDKLMDYSTIRK